MHGTRDEHPEVFKARMQFHKDKKKDEQAKSPKDSAKSLNDSVQDRAQAQEQAQSKRPFPMTRKGNC